MLITVNLLKNRVFISKFKLWSKLGLENTTRKLTFEEYDDVCINFFLSLKRKTMHTYKSYFKLFLAFSQQTGQQIIDSKKADKENAYWETKLLEFKQWMKTQKTKQGNNYSDNAVNIATNSVKSFFE